MKNFLSYIVYCIWTADRICIFVDKGGGLIDRWRNKFILIRRSERAFIIVLGVFTHTYDIINKLFWSTSIFRAWGCQKGYFWCSTMCFMLCYRPLIKLNITDVFGPSWVSITNKLSAKHDNCSFLDWRCLYH